MDLPIKNICRRLCRTGLVLCFVLLFLLPSGVFAEEDIQRFDDLISSAAEKHSIDPLLVKAIVWRESRFVPRAEGASREIGLMQVKMSVVKDWAKAHKVSLPDIEEVFDPYTNIEIGTWYLAKALKNWEGHAEQYALALCEYNAGRTGLLRWIAHFNGCVATTIRHSPSAKYVKSIAEKHLEYILENNKSEALASMETQIPD